MKEKECSENKKGKIRERIWDQKRNWFKFRFTLIFLLIGLIFYGIAILFYFFQMVIGCLIFGFIGGIFFWFFVYPIFEVYFPYYLYHFGDDDDNQK